MTTLKTLRNQAGLSVKEVADRLGVTTSAVTHYENGIRKINLEQVLELSSLYDCAADEVIRAQLNSCLSCKAKSQH